MRFKKTIAYTLISWLITGSFMVYLSTSKQIFQEQYGLKEAFPFIFAGLATASGGAILLNGLFVVKYGTKKIINVSLIGFFLISVCYAFLFYNSVNPPIIIILSFFSLQFFCLGFLFGNLRAIAMEPVGHIAGIGAAITGFISTLMAVPISIVIGKFVRLTVLPIFIGFSICSFISILILIVLTIKAPQNN